MHERVTKRRHGNLRLGQEVGKTLYFHNASLHPELKIGTSKFLVKSGEMPGRGGEP